MLEFEAGSPSLLRKSYLCVTSAYQRHTYNVLSLEMVLASQKAQFVQTIKISLDRTLAKRKKRGGGVFHCCPLFIIH